MDTMTTMATMTKKPVSIMWESTIACGLLCKHCKASAKNEPDPGELTPEEGRALIDQIASFKRPYPILRITGGNALMRGDIFDLIGYAKDTGLNVTIAPSTTPLLNRKNIVKLKDAGTDVVAMSIDGPDAGTHDSFRGVPGTFDRLVKATRIMNEIGLPFRLLTTVTKFNVKKLPEIMMLSRELGAVGWYMYMLIPTGRAREEYGIGVEEYEDVFNFIYDLMKFAPITVNAIAGSEPYRRVAVVRKLVEDGKVDANVLKHGPLYHILKSKLDRFLEDIPETQGLAPASNTPGTPAASTASTLKDGVFGKGIFVSNTGEVFPSSFLPLRLGDVRTDTLKNIYAKSRVLKDMQDTARLRGRCGICEFNDICRGSRSRAYAVTGDYLEEDPYCTYLPGTVGKITGTDNISILKQLKVTNFSRRAS